MRALKLGTRGSRLALWQATWTARALTAMPGSPDIEVEILKTRGDTVRDRPIAQVGVGVFVKELEEALLDGRIDLAVHSLKDLETVIPAGLTLAAIPLRAPVEDCLIAAGDVTLATLHEGAVVATGSPRRRALLRAARPDLVFRPLRGNVPTRLEKVAQGEADVTVLARAGLERLELTDMIREVLDPERFPPAPGQGALGIQCRADDGDALTLAATLGDPRTRAAVTAERAFLRRMGSGCHLAAGAWGRGGEDGSLKLTAFLASDRGTELVRGESAGAMEDAESLGEKVAEDILSRSSESLRSELAGGTS